MTSPQIYQILISANRKSSNAKDKINPIMKPNPAPQSVGAGSFAIDRYQEWALWVGMPIIAPTTVKPDVIATILRSRLPMFLTL